VTDLRELPDGTREPDPLARRKGTDLEEALRDAERSGDHELVRRLTEERERGKP